MTVNVLDLLFLNDPDKLSRAECREKVLHFVPSLAAPY
jgi:hypothetical protein